QAVGLALLYFRRDGFVIDKFTRQALSTFTFGTFISSVARTEATVTKLAFFGIQYPTLGLPGWVPIVSETAMWMAGAALVGLLWQAAKKQNRRVPFIALIPSVSLYFWFVRGTSMSSYFQLVPFFHGIQYLLVAWFMQMRERTEGVGKAPTRSRLFF